MTAGRDALRAAVRGWLEGHRTFTEGAEYRRWLDWAADNLLATPEVRDALQRFAAEQVAAALNDAADEVTNLADAMQTPVRVETYRKAADRLRARAAAVLAAPDNDRRQG